LSTDSVENSGRAIQSRLKIAKGNLTKVCDTYMTQLAKAENVVEGVLREENDVEIDTTGEDEVIEEKVQELALLLRERQVKKSFQKQGTVVGGAMVCCTTYFDGALIEVAEGTMRIPGTLFEAMYGAPHWKMMYGVPLMLKV
jgi:hypothetical protein